MLVTIVQYPDRKELTIGNVIPGHGAQLYTLTDVPESEVEKIMEAKSEDVQKLLSAYLP
jgi:hypothetical protein